MSYNHPQDLNDLHKALQYNAAGQPELRVASGGVGLNSTVAVNNFPTTQTIDGDVNVLNQPSVYPIDDNGGSITIDGIISVDNFPAIQTVDGNIVVSGNVTVDNFPAVQPIDDNGGSITVDGTVDVNNFPAVQPIDDNGGSITVDGDVNVLNFPTVQPIDDNGGSITVDGIVDINNFPAVQTVDGNVGITGNVTIDNFPTVQPIDDNGGSITVDGIVDINNFPAIQTVDGNVVVSGNVTVDNFPTTQTVDGNIMVDNFPAIQTVDGNVVVSGNVTVDNFPAEQTINDGGNSITVDGNITVDNFPTIYPINDNGGSITVDGAVNVVNFPAIQTVDGTVSVDNFPAVQSIDDNGGSITVDGDVNVLNFPTVQPIDDNGGSITVDGTVSIDNFPTVQPVSDNGGSITVDGSVSIDNFPTVQPVSDNGESITVDGEVSVLPNVYNDLGNLYTNHDAFGRLRTSQPYTLFDSTLRYHDKELLWDTMTTGTGFRSYLVDESSLELKTSGAGTVIRETLKVFPYQPGKSLLLLATFNFMETKAGSIKRVGLYGEENGIYFQKTNANSLQIVKRSHISGTTVNTEIPQNLWNVDKLDGTGPSGITLDHEKTQIFWCDVEWLGVGSVRTGFVIGGQFICCHIFHHANIEETAYMTTASLPIRYELISTSLSDSMKQICTSLVSEGGYTNRAITRSVGTSLLGKSLSDLVYRPLVSIRLKSDRLDAIVVPSKFDLYGLQQAAFKYQLLLNPTLTSPTWQNLHLYSNVEYDVSATDLSGGFVIDEGIFVGSNKGGSIAISHSDIDFTRQLGRKINGTSDIFCLAAIATTNNDDAVGSLTWQEH